MVDEQKSTDWGEQAINKLARTAISRLIDAEQLDIDIKMSLKQITQGVIEAIAILFQEVSIRKDLRVRTLQMEIDQVTIKPMSAIRGRIQLVNPSTGRLLIAIHVSQVTAFLNGHLQETASNQALLGAVQIHSVDCRVIDCGAIALESHWAVLGTEELQFTRWVTVPQVVGEGSAVHLIVQAIEVNEPPTELTTVLLTPLQNVLSLEDFSNRGTHFQIQHIDITEDMIKLSADALIEQFPA